MYWSFDGVLLGEKGLWVFVLRRAVHDYAQYRHTISKRFEWQTAAWWIFGEGVDGYSGPFDEEELFDSEEEDDAGLSFDEVCGLMGWDPDAVRALAKRLTREDVKKFELENFMELLDERTQLDFGTPRWKLDGRSSASALTLTPLHYSPALLKFLRLQPAAPIPVPELVSCVALGWA